MDEQCLLQSSIEYRDLNIEPGNLPEHDGEALGQAQTGASILPAALLIAGIMAAVALSEYIFAYRNVGYGILIALVLATLLYVFLALRPAQDTLNACISSLVLVPMYILFTSSLPWFFILQDYLLPAVYSCIIFLCLWHIYQKNLSLGRLFGSFPSGGRLVRYLFLGTGLGVCTGLCEYLILRPAPSYPNFSVGQLLLNLIYMIAFVALGEELLFRALIQSDLSRLFGGRWGLVSASILFSIMHLTWRSVPELFFVFIAGLLFGWLYVRSKGLYLPMLVHGINNVVLMAVYPYLIHWKPF